jgi:hypothetical protein
MSRYAKKRTVKPLLLALTVLTSAALLLGSVLAWTDFTQSRTNKFRGTVDADVILHDEFDGENKDVFVENAGSAAVYVRVRLDEYMKVGDLVFANGADAKDKTTWTPHTYDGPSITDCGNAENGKFHDYYTWEMSGAQRGYTPGTPGMVYDELDADGKVDTTGTETTAAAAAPVKLSDAITIGGKVAASESLTEDEQETWEAITNTGCWLLDDTDEAAAGGGWAYWSKALAPGEATNLLLDQVTLKQDAEDDWIYRIDVKLQAVTANDFEKWDGAAAPNGYKTTADAKTLIAFWQGS